MTKKEKKLIKEIREALIPFGFDMPWLSDEKYKEEIENSFLKKIREKDPKADLNHALIFFLALNKLIYPAFPNYPK